MLHVYSSHKDCLTCLLIRFLKDGWCGILHEFKGDREPFVTDKSLQLPLVNTSCYTTEACAVTTLVGAVMTEPVLGFHI